MSLLPDTSTLDPIDDLVVNAAKGQPVSPPQDGSGTAWSNNNKLGAAVKALKAFVVPLWSRIGLTGSQDPSTLTYQVSALQTAVQALAPGFSLALPYAGTFGPFTAAHTRSSLYLVSGSASTSITKAGGSAVALSTTGTALPLAVGDAFTVTTTGPSTILGN